MNTIKSILAIIFLFVFSNCNSGSENLKETKILEKETVVVKMDSCMPYFNFDEIEHYYLNISEDKAYNPDSVENKTSFQKRKLQFITELYPVNVLELDSVEVKNLEEWGYVKTQLPASQFEDINNVFCERSHDLAQYATCGPVYRDILVFKNNRKIVGVARICFACGMNFITGTKRNTQEFGQSGDYKKLKKLLRP